MRKVKKKIWLLLFVGLITAVLIGSSSVSVSADNPPKKVLRVALTSFGREQLDPAKESSANIFANLYQMYDTLLGCAPDGGMAPGVAKEWKMSEDGLSWTFHLRNGVMFHEGWGELTAEDVKFSLERSMSPEALNILASALRQNVKEIEIVNTYTVRVHTHKPVIDFPYYVSPHTSDVAMILCKNYLLQKGGKDFLAQSRLLNKHPIGSGPYKFVEHVRADHMTFEAVKDHWRKTPAFDRLEIILVPEPATQVSMLRAGEVDIIEVSGDMIAEVEKAGFEVRGIPYSMEAVLIFQGNWWPIALQKGMPITKRKVRQALSLAINRQEIMKHILGGRAQFPAGPFPLGPFTDDLDADYWAKRSKVAYRYDPQRAKELLAEAGYPKGFSGIKLFSYTRPGIPWLTNVTEAIASYWTEIGVEAKIVPIDYGAFRPHFVKAYNDPMTAGHTHILATSVQYVPGIPLGSYYHSKGVIAALNDPELDKLTDNAPAVTDKAKRMEMFRQAFEMVEESTVFSPILASDTLYGVNQNKVGAWQPKMGHGRLGIVYETIEAK